MIIPVDKKKILDEFKTKYVNNRFHEEIDKINEIFNKEQESIKEEIINNFKRVCINAMNLQELGEKGNIQFIHISFLRTRLLENKGVYRIDLYDHNWYLDKTECYIDVSFDFIFQSLFSHISELEEHKKEYGRNITEMDIERIRIMEGNKYHKFTLEILQSMIEDFVNCDEYKNMKKHEELMIIAGEYLDEGITLYQNKK